MYTYIYIFMDWNLRKSCSHIKQVDDNLTGWASTYYTLPITAIRDLGMQRNSFTMRNQQKRKTCGIINTYSDHDHGHR